MSSTLPSAGETVVFQIDARLLMSRSFPRVLFLTSASFNKTTGGGITFSNLFAGWPKDALATIHNDSVPVTYETCERYYRLSEREIRRWGWLRHIPLGKPVADVTMPATPGTSCGLLFSLLKDVKTWIFGDSLPETTCLSSELDAWIAEFRPEVLYTILGSNAMMEMAERIRLRFNLPLVVHIMDDWVSVLYQGGLLSFVQRRKKERLMQYMMDVAAVRMAICDAMASAYEARYRQPFVVFQNAVDVLAVERYVKQPERVGKPLRVAYIGSVFPFAQVDSLADLCGAVQQLADSGMAIRMEIYSPTYLTAQYRDRFVVGTAVELHDTIRDDAEFFATLQAMDVLVLPVNFDKYTKTYIRYSMPTKVPAYLAIGTPILAYGPAEVAQIDYAATAGWGLTVTERDPVQLRSALHVLATDGNLRCRLHAQARRMARERHDTSVVRAQFQSVLMEAVNRQRETVMASAV